MIRYKGYDIIATDLPFTRTRTFKFKNNWLRWILSGFKKYRYITGTSIKDKQGYITKDMKIVVSTRVAKLLQDAIEKDTSDRYSQFIRPRYGNLLLEGF